MIKQLLTKYLNYLRDLSYSQSTEHQAFIRNKLLAHRYYIDNMRLTDPYLHPDAWQDEKVEVIEI